MTAIDPASAEPTIARADEAEVLESSTIQMTLLADSDTTDGVISANRTILRPGADGPPPHFHARSAELFFLLSGSLEALAGERVLTLEEGDFLLVPRGTPHAFAAPPGAEADVLIVFAPAIENRFEYFRLVDRVVKGQASPEEILRTQELYDNHFVESPAWRESRTADAWHHHRD